MKRRDFLKYAAVLSASAMLEAQGIIRASEPVKTGMWFYLGHERKSGFRWDLDIMNNESIGMLKDYAVDRVYVAGVDAIINKNPVKGAFNQKEVRHFMQKCSENGIEPHVVGLEDHHFLEYSKSDLLDWFNNWLDNTKDLCNIYQVNIEPHAYDLDGETNQGLYFRNNPKGRKQLLKRYLDCMDLLYNQADRKNVKLAPAVPMVDEPSIIEKLSMNYHTLLREEGLCDGGLNDIPAHYLHIMSYSLNPECFREMCYNNIGDINRDFALSSSNFPNAFDPYFKDASEFSRMPPILEELNEYNPRLKEHLLFCNLSIQDKLEHIKYAKLFEDTLGMSAEDIDRQTLIRYWQGEI